MVNTAAGEAAMKPDTIILPKAAAGVKPMSGGQDADATDLPDVLVLPDGAARTALHACMKTAPSTSHMVGDAGI